MILWKYLLNLLSSLCPLTRSTTVSTMRLMCIGSTGGDVMGHVRTASPTLATWRGPWTGLRRLWIHGGRTTRGLVVGLTPRSKNLKDMAKKARRMVNRTGRPQRRSIQVQPQVMSLLLCCIFGFNSCTCCVFAKYCQVCAVQFRKDWVSYQNIYIQFLTICLYNIPDIFFSVAPCDPMIPMSIPQCIIWHKSPKRMCL